MQLHFARSAVSNGAATNDIPPRAFIRYDPFRTVTHIGFHGTASIALRRAACILAPFQYDTSRSLSCVTTLQREKTMCATGRHAEVNEAITMTTISGLELRSK